jgi:hypothetical protein
MEPSLFPKEDGMRESILEQSEKNERTDIGSDITPKGSSSNMTPDILSFKKHRNRFYGTNP